MIQQIIQFFSPKRATFQQILKEYFEKRASEGLSESTIEKHGYFHENILKFLKFHNLENCSYKEIRIKTMMQLETWLHGMEGGCSLNHASRHISHCQAAFDHAIKMEHCKYNPIAVLVGKQNPDKEIISLEANEIIKIFNCEFKTETEKDVAILFLFQCFTGLSYMDLWIYEVKEDAKEKGLNWVTSKIGRGKNKKAYWAELNQLAKEIHELYNGKLPYVGNQVYNKTIKRIAKRLKIEKELTSHVARKTYATLRYAQGYSIESIADELGNSPEILRKHYITRNSDRIRGEINRLKGVPFLEMELIPVKR